MSYRTLMTALVLFFAPTILLVCNTYADESPANCKSISAVYDEDLNLMDKDFEFIATRETPSGKIIGYPPTDEGAAQIISFLKAQHITNKKVLSKEFWLAQGSSCKKTAGNQCYKYRNCRAGYSCKPYYTGGITACRCQ